MPAAKTCSSRGSGLKVYALPEPTILAGITLLVFSFFAVAADGPVGIEITRGVHAEFLGHAVADAVDEFVIPIGRDGSVVHARASCATPRDTSSRALDPGGAFFVSRPASSTTR